MADLRFIGWPMHLQEIPELMELDRVSDNQISKLEDAISDLDDDICITTASEQGIARREKILGIKPLDTDTLEDRRMRVLSKWYDVYPYTDTDLKRRLDQLCGVDGYTMEMDYANQVLKVRLALTQKAQYMAVTELLEAIVPCYIILDIDIMYNKWKDFAPYKWSEKSTLTWQQAKEEVIK